MSLNQLHLDIYKYGRNFCRNAAKQITADNLHNRAVPATWSAGYLIRHIAESELFFAKIFFDETVDMSFEVLAPRDGKDDGQVKDAEALAEFVRSAEDRVRTAIMALPEDQWHIPRQTIFGEISPSQGMGILLMHTSYHAGQAMTAIKHGK